MHRPPWGNHVNIIPKSELKAALKLLKDHGGNISRAANACGMARATFRDRITAANRPATPQFSGPQILPTADLLALKKENALLRGKIERMSAAKPFKPVKIVKRSGKDDILRVIMPDSHGAYADPVAMSLFLDDLKKLQPDEIVMLGDHVDAGGFLAAHHTLGFVAQMAYTYEADILACNGHLDLIQKNAPKATINYISGNHEDRIERWCIGQALASAKDAAYLHRAFAPRYLLDLKGRGIEYFERSVTYDGLSIPGAIKRGKTIFVHDPGFTDPRRTIARFGAPVVHGHNHQTSAIVTTTVGAGEVGVWSFGCLALKQQLYQHSRPSQHVHGYGIQLQARSGHFLTVSIPIIDGVSYMARMFK